MKKYNISEARKNFTSIIKDAEINKETIMITNRNEPIAYIVDFETASKYIPKQMLKNMIDLEPGNGERLVAMLDEFNKKNRKYFKGKKTEDISGNIDKILYGT